MALDNIKVNNQQVIAVDKQPILESDNLVNSGGVYNSFVDQLKNKQTMGYIDSEDPMNFIFPYWYEVLNLNGTPTKIQQKYALTRFIPVYKGDTLNYKIVAPNERPAIAFYNAPTYDDFVSVLVIGNSTLQNSFVKIQNDGYIIACCHVENFNIAELRFDNRDGLRHEMYERNLRFAFIHKSILNANNAFSNHGNLIDDYGYRPATTALGSNYTNYRNTGFIFVKNGDKLHYKLDVPNTKAGICFYSDCKYESFESVLVWGSSAIISGVLNIISDGYIIAVCHKDSINIAELYIEGNFEDRTNILENNISNLENNILNINSTVEQLTANVENVNLEISEKINKPENIGNKGQVLTLSDDGKTQWSNAGIPTDEQVEQSVRDWLEEHPEATTTVQNGSITPSKIAPGQFIAGGHKNQIITWAERDTQPRDSHVEGVDNRSYEWNGHAEGSRCFVDGKISHAEGNACICSGNDSHAEGNRTVTGRKYFTNAKITPYLVKGSEDAGDSLGTLNYVIIPDSFGDVTSYFPNKFTDNIEQRYGVGAQKDSQGNIYKSGNTPAVWDDETVIAPNDLMWALHCYCILRGVGESSIEFVKIAKSIYIPSVGTKVYYFGRQLYEDYRGIYSSYSPVLLHLGNGLHSEGYFTSACGYGSHAEGNSTEAWGDCGSHAEGNYSRAHGVSSHAEGYNTLALGEYSHSDGAGSIAKRKFQKSYAAQLYTNEQGKRQSCEIILDQTYTNWGWHIIPLIDNIENNKTYYIESIIMGKQISGNIGNVGDEFIYKVVYCVSIDEQTNATFFGTPTVQLIGRTEGMEGDGITTGIRMSAYNTILDNTILVRFDNVNNVTFRIFAHTKWEEMSI